jgi:DNA-binding NtrC family response regulator
LDARVVAASATDLGDLVAAGWFSRPLPPAAPARGHDAALRDHMEDARVVEHFLAEMAEAAQPALRVSPEAIGARALPVARQRRELRNAVRGAAVMAARRSGLHLPAAVRCGRSAGRRAARRCSPRSASTSGRR